MSVVNKNIYSIKPNKNIYVINLDKTLYYIKNQNRCSTAYYNKKENCGHRFTKVSLIIYYKDGADVDKDGADVVYNFCYQWRH